MLLRLSHVIVIVFCVFFVELSSQEAAFRTANLRYQNEDYQGAVAIYDSLVTSGHASFSVYYNMGNAYLHLRQIDQAILNYEKAKLLSSSKELDENLSTAEGLITEPIPQFSDFFLIKWWNSLLKLFGSNGYAIIGLLVFFMAMVFLWRRWQRDASLSFFGGPSLLMLIGVLCLGLSWAALQLERSEVYAVVMRSERSLYIGADERSDEIRKVAAGVKVKVLDSISKWKKVSLPDKDIGWMHEDHLAPVEVLKSEIRD